MTDYNEKPLFEKYLDLAKYRNKLNINLERQHEAATIIAAKYWLNMDMLIFAFIDRSISLINGFITLVDDWNYIASAPFVRMQLDNLIRLAYLASLKDGKDIYDKTIEGIHWRSIKAKNGKLLTDTELRKYATKYYSWIDEVYEKASGFIHFSDRHLLIMTNEDSNKGQVEISIGHQATHLNKEDWKDLLSIFLKITEATTDVIRGWVQRKQAITSDK